MTTTHETQRITSQDLLDELIGTGASRMTVLDALDDTLRDGMAARQSDDPLEPFALDDAAASYVREWVQSRRELDERHAEWRTRRDDARDAAHSKRDAAPTGAVGLYEQLVETEEEDAALVRGIIDQVVAGGLEIEDQTGREPSDPLLSVREVRTVYALVDGDIDNPAWAYHVECCPRWCDVDNRHDAPAEAEQLGYVEHGTVLARGVLPECRRTPNRVTRPHQGAWRVERQQRVHRLEGGRQDVDGVSSAALVEDEVIVLVHQDPGEVGTAHGREVRTLPGEVLHLIAAMQAAVGELI